MARRLWACTSEPITETRVKDEGFVIDREEHLAVRLELSGSFELSGSKPDECQVQRVQHDCLFITRRYNAVPLCMICVRERREEFVNFPSLSSHKERCLRTPLQLTSRCLLIPTLVYQLFPHVRDGKTENDTPGTPTP